MLYIGDIFGAAASVSEASHGIGDQAQNSLRGRRSTKHGLSHRGVAARSGEPDVQLPDAQRDRRGEGRDHQQVSAPEAGSEEGEHHARVRAGASGPVGPGRRLWLTSHPLVRDAVLDERIADRQEPHAAVERHQVGLRPELDRLTVEEKGDPGRRLDRRS